MITLHINNFSLDKANGIYAESCGQVITLPKTATPNFLLQQQQKNSLLWQGLIRLANSLPEYETVTSIYGVEEITSA